MILKDNNKLITLYRFWDSKQTYVIYPYDITIKVVICIYISTIKILFVRISKLRKSNKGSIYSCPFVKPFTGQCDLFEKLK